MEHVVGRTIKGYELRERIGAGGFGAVYKAYQSTVGREVAIKIILPGFANHPDFIRRFEAEAQIIARLEHLHITPLYDYWREPDGAYLVMRWLKGGSLRDMLDTGTPYDPPSAAFLLDQITSALSVAHRHQVIHRDLKPSNVLLDEDGNAYLADFGIAKDLNLRGDVTDPDAIVGSPDYLSPEQARSEAVTPQTDIYSLGIVLYEMLTGQHPFPNLSTVERLYKHLSDPLPLIDTFPPELGGAINEVIQKATAKNPVHRFADAMALAVAFRQAVKLAEGDEQGDIVETLTQREQEILHFIIEGRSNKEIAQELFITLTTVKWYITQIYRKLKVRSRVQAIVRARELNLIYSTTSFSMPTLDEPTHLAPDDFQPENPYKGLLAFQSADHRDFFGREDLVKKLLKRMGESGEMSRFLAIVGPSGSGKSSLVKAGLIPALWRGELPKSDQWFIVEMLPGSRPLDKLEVALTRIAATQSDNLYHHLQRDQHGLSRIAELILPNDGSELVLVIDQFEEIFTLVEDEALRVQFLNLLYAAVTEPRSRVRVVITLRADFYDRPLHYPDFGELVRNRMETILPLGAQGLERAILKPAERIGVTFEAGLVPTIIEEIHYQAGVLPLLQYALTELFERRQGRLLTHAAYREIGGTSGALAQRAEEVFQEFDTMGQEAVRQMFLRLVTLGEGTEDTRRRTARSELLATSFNPDLMDEVIDTYTAYRLLSLDNDPATHNPTVEVAHEAILREWKRLHSWLDESRDDIRIQRQLTATAKEWQDAQQDDSFLLRGSRLEMFEKWAEETQLALTPRERTFLQASLKQREQEQAAEQERHAREIRLEQRSRTFLRGLVGVFAIATVIAIGLSIFAFGQRSRAENALSNEQQARSDAEDSAEYARSLALASAAQTALLNNNPDQALALAVAANTTTDDPPGLAQNILYAAAFTPATQKIFSQGSDAGILSLSADEKLMLSASGADGIVILWDMISGQEIRRFDPDPSAPNKLTYPVFSPDASSAFVAIFNFDDKTGGLVQWDIQSGTILRRFQIEGEERFSDGLVSIALSPDGQIVLGGTIGGNIFAWDTTTGELLRQFSEMHIFINFLVFAEDGKMVMSGSDDGLVILWDVATGEPVQRYDLDGSKGWIGFGVFTAYGIVAHQVSDEDTLYLLTEDSQEVILKERGISALGVSPDGKTLALGFANSRLHLFDLATHQITQQLFGHTRRINDTVFTQDGQHLITASNDDTVRLWQLRNLAQVQHIKQETIPAVIYTFRPQSSQVLIQNENQRLAIWDLITRETIQEFEAVPDTLFGVFFTPDGEYVLAISNNNPGGTRFCWQEPRSQLTLLDTATGEILRQFEAVEDYVAVLGFSPDGRLVASTSECSGQIFLWEMATGKLIASWEGHQAIGLGVVFSPDSHFVASGSMDNTVIVWDVATGEKRQVLPHDDFGGPAIFNHDSSLLLTGSGDTRMRLWDLATGQELRRFEGHSSMIDTVLFSPDERFGVSLAKDGYLVVWDLQTGEAVRRIRVGEPGGGAWAEYSPDGQSVVVRNLIQGTIQEINLWLDPQALLEWTYQNRYVRELTCNERELYRVEPYCDTDDPSKAS